MKRILNFLVFLSFLGLYLIPTEASAFQRDIYWSFSQNPTGSGYPLPGATYSGTYDSSVGGADSFGMAGSVGWNSSPGRIGYSNPTPFQFGELHTGNLNLHLSGLGASGSSKRMYIEYMIYSNLTSTYTTDPWLLWSLSVPLGSSIPSWGAQVDNISADSWQVNMWADIFHNADWANLSLAMVVPGGTYLWMDDLHISTESLAIPIPAAVWLLGSGLMGLVGIRRRKAHDSRRRA